MRQLDEWGLLETDVSRQDFAERLGRWLGVSDAIQLHAAHQSIRADARAKAPPANRSRADDVAALYRQGRAALGQAIALAAKVAGESAETEYAPHLQRYIATQSHLESRVAALRAQVRQAVCRVAPALRPLAALDAALESALTQRAQLVLSVVPVLLGKRFEYLRRNHAVAQEAKASLADAGRERQPGGWHDVFLDDWRAVLQAELELRLDPVLGLMEAMQCEAGEFQ